MNRKQINTKKDYQNALSRIEELWDTNPNSSEVGELDILATLVEAYESKHFKIYSPIQADTIKNQIKKLVRGSLISPLMNNNSNLFSNFHQVSTAVRPFLIRL